MVTRMAACIPPQPAQEQKQKQPVHTERPKPKPTCMFCGQPQSPTRPVYELDFRDTATDRTTKEYYCKDCLEQLKKLVQHLSDIPELPEPSTSKYGKYMNGLLKDFLCSDVYLKAETEIVFFDKTNTEIKEFTSWINQTIYNITEETEYIKVVLNDN